MPVEVTENEVLVYTENPQSVSEMSASKASTSVTKPMKFHSYDEKFGLDVEVLLADTSDDQFPLQVSDNMFSACIGPNDND